MRSLVPDLFCILRFLREHFIHKCLLDFFDSLNRENIAREMQFYLVPPQNYPTFFFG